MSARTTALVVEREVREAARRKGVWALVALVFLGSTAIVVLPSILSSDTDTETIGVVGGDDAVGRQIVDVLEAIDDPRIETTELPDRAEAVDQIESGDIGLAVIFDPGDADRVDATRSAPVLVVENDDSDLVRTVAATISDQLVVTSLEDRGLDPDAVSDAFTSAQPTVQQVDDDRDGRQGAAFAITLVLYLLIVILASQVANGVAIEKSNRVSEVLLAIVPPRSLLYGKVIGVGLIGLVTLIAGALPVLIRQITSGGLPDGLAIVLLASGAWCVLGLALYLTLAGSLGARRSPGGGRRDRHATDDVPGGRVHRGDFGGGLRARCGARLRPVRVADGRTTPHRRRGRITGRVPDLARTADRHRRRGESVRHSGVPSCDRTHRWPSQATRRRAGSDVLTPPSLVSPPLVTRQ